MSFLINAACGCNTGRIRRNNEDNFFFDGLFLEEQNQGLSHTATLSRALRGDFFVAVFDGMGGESYGECAAYTAADTMRGLLMERRRFFIPKSRFLNEMCVKLNIAVIERAKTLKTERMGSTLVSLYFTRNHVYVCNLGDSRAYRLRAGTLIQISQDHIEHRIGLKKQPLTQHLGIDPNELMIEPYIAKDELKSGDKYLLCSDGLTDMLSDSEIGEIMSRSKSVEDSVQLLIKAAIERGGRDNVTTIVCWIQ